MIEASEDCYESALCRHRIVIDIVEGWRDIQIQRERERRERERERERERDNDGEKFE